MKMNYKKLCQNIINNECAGYENSRLFTQAYTSGRSDSFDEPYYGGGESDWGNYDETTLEEFKILLTDEVGKILAEEFGVDSYSFQMFIEKCMDDEIEFVRERFGLHDEPTESDIIRAVKLIRPRVAAKYGD